MFTINDDLSIHATRGDTVFFTVTAEENGTPYFFEAGDVLRMKIYGKKNAKDVVLEKLFPVTARTDRFTILLTEEDTKIGEVISKPKDYWYEIELNPFTNPQTIIGYDEDGAKVFKLFPEGKDSEVPETDPEDIPVVDIELDMTSNRPVQNQAIARAIVNIDAACKVTEKEVKEKAKEFSTMAANFENKVAVERKRIDNLVSGATADDAEIVDVRVGVNGVTYPSAGTAVRKQISGLHDDMNLSQSGYEKLKSTFSNGGLNLDGTLTTQLYYVSTTAPVQYDYDVRLRVKPGYSYTYYSQNSDGSYSASSVLTRDTIVPKGTKFLVRIQTDPVTYDKADVELFAGKVYCESVVGNAAYNTEKNTLSINLLKNGNEGLSGLFNWGSLSSGNWALWVLYRVCTPEAMIYDRKINISVADGFMFAVHTFDSEGKFQTDSSWMWKYTVDANVPFKVVIKRVTEDTNEVADIKEFASAVTITSAFKENVLEDRHNPFKKNFICHGKSPLVGHMGLRPQGDYSIPENTVAAYEYAGKSGIWAMETDIHETADGHFVCIHDPTLDRTTTGTGNVADKTLAEIKELYIKDFVGEVTEHRVPTFEEYLSVCKMYGIVPLIEIKAISTYAAFFDIIRKHGFMDNAMLTGGLWRLESIRKYSDMLYIVLPTQTDYADVYDTIKNHHCVGVSLMYTNETLTEEVICKMHEHNIFVQVWSINDVDIVKSWFRKGVDAVVTDFLTNIN